MLCKFSAWLCRVPTLRSSSVQNDQIGKLSPVGCLKGLAAGQFRAAPRSWLSGVTYVTPWWVCWCGLAPGLTSHPEKTFYTVCIVPGSPICWPSNRLVAPLSIKVWHQATKQNQPKNMPLRLNFSPLAFRAPCSSPELFTPVLAWFLCFLTGLFILQTPLIKMRHKGAENPLLQLSTYK